MKRSRHHSPAMRAKIGRAVKLAMARRRSGGGSARPVRRVSRRRRSVAVVHTRPISRRRRSVRAFGGVARRRSFRRRGARRFGGGGGGAGSLIKQLTSRQTLSLAGGAIGASFVTTYILSNYGAKLPGATSQYGRIFYKLAIPTAGAFLVKKVNRDAATGMLVGGIVMAVNDLIANMGSGAKTVSGYSEADSLDGYAGEADFATKAYMADEEFGAQELSAGEDDGLGEYFEGAEFRTDPLYQSQPAFQTSFN